MDKGITAILSVGLLAAIMLVGAASVVYWLSGSVTKAPTTNTPFPLAAIAMDNDYLTMTVLAANTGTSTIPAGTVMYVAENGVTATLAEDLPSGSQVLITFVGYDDGRERFFPSGLYTIYGARVGQARVATVALCGPPETLPKTPVSPNANGDYNPCLEEAGGHLYLAWDSDRLDPGGNYEILVTNSSDGVAWGAETRVSDSQTNKNPSLVHNGTHFGMAWDTTNPANEHIFTKDSADSLAWSPKVQAENENNRNREPAMIVDAAGSYWVAWASEDLGNYDVYLKMATGFKGFSGQPSIAINTNTSEDAYPSLIEDAGGKYWIAFQSNRSGQEGLWVVNSSNGVVWGEPVEAPARAGAMEPSLIQDAGGRYWMAYYTSTGVTDYIWVMHSDDMRSWSASTRVSASGVNEKSPFLMQAGDGTYWMAFEGRVGGNWEIYVRSTENAMYWQ